MSQDKHVVGTEALDYSFEGGQALPAFSPILVGVVGSGNLEVLLEPLDDPARCVVTVQTSARGFGTIWQAVARDFHARHRLGGLRVSIHDMGATPAVVSLRLDQAVAELGLGGRPA